MLLSSRGRGPGGNFIQPTEDWNTRAIAYLVFVGWIRQPDEYESHDEALEALRRLLEEER